MLLCEAVGFDVVLVETVGVGQSEIAVAEMVDLLLLLSRPGGGDELQGIKRGIMELADLVVVHKADGELADAAAHAAADYGHALHLLRRKWQAWEPRVVPVGRHRLAGWARSGRPCRPTGRPLLGSTGELERSHARAPAWAWLWSWR